MGRSRETYNKKEVRSKKEKKRKEKEQKRLARKENEKKGNLDDMIAYVDEFGMISSTPPDPKKKEIIKLQDIETSIPKKDDTEQDPVREGKVVFYDKAKGYGFIKDSETEEKIFVHESNLFNEVEEGSVVRFEILPGKRGLTAVGVKLV
ncbi:DNA-binding protein [miscellaneous Crenarchaeota group archaeon SMTZ-80]|nr:MAG: DNA-binding protein [miscellaneous Crenarchaeota group archaeon SMTZ-80]